MADVDTDRATIRAVGGLRSVKLPRIMGTMPNGCALHLAHWTELKAKIQAGSLPTPAAPQERHKE